MALSDERRWARGGGSEKGEDGEGVGDARVSVCGWCLFIRILILLLQKVPRSSSSLSSPLVSSSSSVAGKRKMRTCLLQGALFTLNPFHPLRPAPPAFPLCSTTFPLLPASTLLIYEQYNMLERL